MGVAAPSEAGRDVREPARRPRASRVSAGHAVIALAALVAVVANYAALRARDDSVRVAVLAADVAAGDPVGADALAFAEVRAGEALLATLVTADEAADVDGVAVRSLAPGDVLRRSDLAADGAPDGLRAMSLPITPERAVGGRLAPGDRVDVIEVRDAEAVYLVTGAEVLDVPARTGGAPGLGGLQAFSVTLAVDGETALRLALALRTSELALVRSTGAAPAGVERVGVELERVGAPEDAP